MKIPYGYGLINEEIAVREEKPDTLGKRPYVNLYLSK